jgi:hypothetical protein
MNSCGPFAGFPNRLFQGLDLANRDSVRKLSERLQEDVKTWRSLAAQKAQIRPHQSTALQIIPLFRAFASLWLLHLPGIADHPMILHPRKYIFASRLTNNISDYCRIFFEQPAALFAGTSRRAKMAED